MGVRSASFSDAELMLSSDSSNMKFTQEFSCFLELFFAAQLNFLTASQQVFDTLTEAQRHVLVAAGRDTELAQWKVARGILRRDHQDMASRGVSVVTQPPPTYWQHSERQRNRTLRKLGPLGGCRWRRYPGRLPSGYRARVARPPV